ncbi:phage tail tube protein [Actinosynnema sp. NPDC020468]|uniref:phage tail tube protein n=1 Tax=Actinosynnema sp. NPDC020468 TaxID=3154488 RepID=UPI0033C6F247
MALDAAISIGAESAYGVAASATRGYEGQSDSWKAKPEFVESKGFRSGLQTVRADRRRIVDMGGEGELELDLLDDGARTLLTAAFDTVSSTGDAHTFATAGSTVPASFTAQMVRPKVDGGTVPYKHVGCVVTEWEFEQEVENPLKFKATFDFQTVSHNGPPLPIDYPETSVPYDWTRGVVYLTRNGTETPVAVTKWSAKGNRGLKTDRRFIRGNQLKAQPKRAELPSYEGELEVEFDTATLPLYESFLAGAVLGFRVAYDGVTGGSALELRCPAIQFTGESPEASLDDLTRMTLPFAILDPGTSAAVSVVYTEPGD